MITITIPYLKTSDGGRELRFALRSWQKNLTKPHQVMIVGDSEPWFNHETLIYVPMEQSSSNPQVNTVRAMILAINHPQMSEVMVWTFDDVYVANPLNVYALYAPTYFYSLDNPHGDETYNANKRRTRELLEANGLNTWQFDNHMPFYMLPKLLNRLFNEVPQLQEGCYLVPSYYFNWGQSFHAPQIKLEKGTKMIYRVTRRTTDEAEFIRMLATRQYINNNCDAFTPMLAQNLWQLFPEKSQYETVDF